MFLSGNGYLALTTSPLSHHCCHRGAALVFVFFFHPHHGSRRNVSTGLLDRWLGQRLPSQLTTGQETFSSYISSAKEDEAHPRKAVVRALVHRGAGVFATEGVDLRTSFNAPPRAGWTSAKPLKYPQEQENADGAKSAAA
jgi:hypothetical protein